MCISLACIYLVLYGMGIWWMVCVCDVLWATHVSYLLLLEVLHDSEILQFLLFSLNCLLTLDLLQTHSNHTSHYKVNEFTG